MINSSMLWNRYFNSSIQFFFRIQLIQASLMLGLWSRDLLVQLQEIRVFTRIFNSLEKLPCDIRPPHILVMTLEYLFGTVLPLHGLEKSYYFIRSRTRAIRNDFTLQNYRGREAIECHEKIARFHILCCHELCQVLVNDIQQEHEQLKKTLQSLSEFYKDSRGIYSSPNEAEFQAYYILMKTDQSSFIQRLERHVPNSIFLDNRVQQAIDFSYLCMFY
jgi:hypothetical protein